MTELTAELLAKHSAAWFILGADGWKGVDDAMWQVPGQRPNKQIRFVTEMVEAAGVETSGEPADLARKCDTLGFWALAATARQLCVENPELEFSDAVGRAHDLVIEWAPVVVEQISTACIGWTQEELVDECVGIVTNMRTANVTRSGAMENLPPVAPTLDLA